MKIGIDIRTLGYFSAGKSGLYQHVYNLVSTLLAVDGHNEYSLLATFRGFSGDDRITGRFLRRFPGRLSAVLLERLSVPVEFLVGKVDVFHGPCFLVPRARRSKIVATLHDLMPITHPEFLKPEWAVARREMIAKATDRADVIIVVSDFTKQEIRETLGVSEDRIRVVFNGVGPVYRPVEDPSAIEQVKGRYGIRGPYLLFVGNLEPKKNVLALIEAWVILRRETRFQGSLVIVGQKDWHFDAVWRACQRHHVENDVIFTGVVDGGDLPYLYSGAEAFVFPSLFEGFGIPVIEAMACGTPVIASNRASIPEIASDAAMLVDPLKPSEIAAAVHHVLGDPSARKALVEKGLRRAKEFSWEQTARETLGVYNELGCR